ncbi:hypothetical protein MASR1M45_27910 [Candidatus Kapaibacterium sp.]
MLGQQTYTVGSNKTVENSMEIVNKELTKMGLKRLNELIKLAKSRKGSELIQQLAKPNHVKNITNPDDKSLYAESVGSKEDLEFINEFVDFFVDLDKQTGKKKKIRIGIQSSDEEPIGHAFRMIIPGKKFKNVYCNHYTVSFRLSIDGKYLVTEWYSMPGNIECQ